MECRVDVSNETPEGKFQLFSLTKDMPYIMDSTFYRYEFQKNEAIIKGCIIFEINKHVFKHYV